MPQALLPLIPSGATQLSDLISVFFQDGQWTYFCGVQPVFEHPEDDRQSFRMFTAQLCCRGACTQAQIIRAFGVSKNSVLRSVAKYLEEGIDGFYGPRRGRGASVMTAEVIVQAEKLLAVGHSRNEVAKELDVKCDTLRKAINQGRVQEPSPVSTEEVSAPPQASQDRKSVV